MSIINLPYSEYSEELVGVLSEMTIIPDDSEMDLPPAEVIQAQSQTLVPSSSVKVGLLIAAAVSIIFIAGRK